jgi:ABC-type Fe3+-hydroxamate transport system substrate-binding protein
MRLSLLVFPIAALLLTACGSTTERTVVITPAPGSTVVVPPNGQAHVVPNGN